MSARNPMSPAESVIAANCPGYPGRPAAESGGETEMSPLEAIGTLMLAQPGPSPSLAGIAEEIINEVASAEAKWPPMNSAHEAYAVLLEEVDELWEHVKTNQKRRDLAGMRSEAVQVAAMAVRFIRDVCDQQRGRK